MRHAAASDTNPSADAHPGSSHRGGAGAPSPEPTATPSAPDGFDAAEYFSGKTVTFISGFSPGGGYDVYMRLAAVYPQEHLAGNPRIVVQNLPGSGGERGLREAMRAEPDGLTVGILHPAFIKRELVGIDVPDFDLNTVGIIGTPNFVEVTDIYHTRSDVATSWEEVLALGRPLVHGQDVPGATGETAAKFIELIGGPVRVIYGYGGSADAHAAFDRGEVDTGGGSCSLGQTPQLFPEHIEQDLCKPLFWYGPIPPEEDPLIQEWLELIDEPVPPHIFDLPPMSDVPQWQKDMFDLVQGLNMASHIFVLPPNVPEEILNAWREAFQDMLQTPEFREIVLNTGRTVGYGGSDELTELFDSGLRSVEDPEHREFFLDYLGVVE